jgi:hypothetical protein
MVLRENRNWGPSSKVHPSPDGEGVGTVMQQAFNKLDLFAPATY